MRNYVDHNASITVTVKKDEWDEVENWLFENGTRSWPYPSWRWTITSTAAAL
jgi:hypothetical protein